MDLFTLDVQVAAIGIFVITAGLRKVLPWFNTSSAGRRLIVVIPALLGLGASFGGGIEAAIGKPLAVQVSWGLTVALMSSYAHKFLKQVVAGEDPVIIARRAEKLGYLTEDLTLPPDNPRRGSVRLPLMIGLMALGLAVIIFGAILILESREDRGFLVHPKTRAEARWPAGALPVIIELPADDPRFADEWALPLQAAADLWNTAAERPLVRVARRGELQGLARVPVVPMDLAEGQDPDEHPHANPRIAPDGAIVAASITLPRGIPWIERRTRIAAHEIGHVLGFGGPGPRPEDMHDDDERSVMYRRSVAPSGSTGTWAVSPADRDRARRYVRTGG